MGVAGRVESAAAAMRSLMGREGIAPPKVGMVLGSGLGPFADRLGDPFKVSCTDLPGYPRGGVEGHEGSFVFGTCEGVHVLALRGRLHHYEGHGMDVTALPIRIMGSLGVGAVILTNAAGGVSRRLAPGDFMVISDHLNLSGSNPLIGANLDGFGPRFPDMTDVYTASLRERLKGLAMRRGIRYVEGVYAMCAGPSYETPAEVRLLGIVGADAVGMSTVPEAIAAAHGGMKVIGISCIANMAAGLSGAPLSHGEVLAAAGAAGDAAAGLLRCAVLAAAGHMG